MSQPETASSPLSSGSRHCDEPVRTRDYRPCTSDEVLANQGCRDARTGSLEYLCSDHMLQFRDSTAKGRLFDTNRASGAIETAVIGCGNRVAKLGNIKRQAPET